MRGSGSWRVAVLCAGCAACLFSAAIAKVYQPNPTIEVIRTMLGVERGAAAALLGVLLVVEFFIASWLISGRAVRAALGTLLVFLLGVSGVVAWLLMTGRKLPCGCGLPSIGTGVFGGAHARAWEQGMALGRNAVLMILAATALMIQQRGERVVN